MDSFSSKLKKELSKINCWKNKDSIKYEFIGYLITSDSNRIITENEYNINRFIKLLDNLKEEKFKIEIIGNKYCVTLLKFNEICTKYLNDFEKNNIDNNRAIVRGAFLRNGVFSDLKKYHIEILFSNIDYANLVKEILEKSEIFFKITKRKKDYILYSKDGENISSFLAFIGGTKSLLDFEELRTVKEVRNNVNRQVNCETANLEKIIKTSTNQINDIKYLTKIKKINLLNEKQKEIAEIRLKNPRLTLSDLGKKLEPKLGKSGVNNRFRQIHDIAEEQRNGEK